MPYLIMDKNFQGYKVFQFSDNVTIGRSGDNDICLNDDKAVGDDKPISRRHAHIKKIQDDFILFDTSRNGTYINETRIKEFRLSHGESFQILNFAFSFIEDSAAESIEQKSEIDPAHRKVRSFDLNETTVFDESMVDLEEKISLQKSLRKQGIIIKSECMISLYRDVKEIAGINVPVLIVGEPGTGKEKVAQALHDFSSVKGDFVALNCSSIPEGIFESELFGSVRGAFHNATDKPGKIELSDNGTIFFDEIGDMALSIQPRLLRFFEDNKITRLGDTRVKTINTRVVAATNQNLDVMMKKKQFRDDLYQRVACIKLKTPPLRQRLEDIIPLSKFFLLSFSKEHNMKTKVLSKKSQKKLLTYPWYGNIRELRNVLLNAAIKSQDDTIQASHLSIEPDKNVDYSKATIEEPFLTLQDVEKIQIDKALKQSGNNKSLAAKLLGISRNSLYQKIEKYNLIKI